MLISCPKCHSIYEIPDDLIGKTGRNFRCQACANVWHALREDAVGYEPEKEEQPFIEAIEVSEPPHRHYPANRKEFNIPADSKSGVKTRSSKEIIAKEGNPDYIPPAPAVKKQKEITLTSDHGTSFTISTAPHLAESDNDRRTPHLFTENEGLRISAEDRLLPEQPFKGYKKTYAFLLLLILVAAAFFLRREIVAVYPTAETWYNQIALTGLNNPEYLRFENIEITEEKLKDRPVLKINAVIANDSFYTVAVPPITVSGTKKTFSAAEPLIGAHKKTSAEIIIPAPQKNAAVQMILGFAHPQTN